MNSPENGTRPAAEHPKSKRQPLGWLALGVVSLVLITVFLCHWLSERSEPTLQWLTQTEFSRTTAIGPLQALGYRLMSLTAPFWRGYYSRRPQLSISARLYELTGEAGSLSALSAATSTNADGQRAWLLKPGELKALKEEISTNGGMRLVTQAAIQTASGVRCTVVTGTSASVPTELRLDALAQVTPGWIRLLADVSSVNNRLAQSAQSTTARTNLAAACRVLFPNQGGLILAARRENSGSGPNYWVVLSGTAIDSKGNPVQPAGPTAGR